MEKNKKAILLINETLDLLIDMKYMYAKDYLNLAIKEINKIQNNNNKNKNKNKNKKNSNNPNLSLKMVEKIINKEKNNLRNNK